MRPTERRRKELQRAERRRQWVANAAIWNETMRVTAELVPADFRPLARKVLRSVPVDDEQAAFAALREALPPKEYDDLQESLQTLTRQLAEQAQNADPPPAPEYPPLLTGEEMQDLFTAEAVLEEWPVPALPEGTNSRYARGYARGWVLGLSLRLRLQAVKLRLAVVFYGWAERLAQ